MQCFLCQLNCKFEELFTLLGLIINIRNCGYFVTEICAKSYTSKQLCNYYIYVYEFYFFIPFGIVCTFWQLNGKAVIKQGIIVYVYIARINEKYS